jgi:uncharacterized protein (TIGR02996 family)
MNEEEALLQAVLEHPDEDGPRLAYAEWAESQTEESIRARAGFIRAQIAILRMDDAAIDRGESYRHETLSDRLRERYGVTWAGPIPAMAQNYAFGRGFVEYIRISARGFLDRAAELFAVAPIQHVDLTGVRDVTEELFASPYLARLRSLSMDRCGLYDIHLQMLAASVGANNLGWLSVTNNNIDMDGIEAIPNSPYLKKLRYVDLEGNPVNPGERVATESGVVIESWLPEPGKELESRHGYLPWLHYEGAVTRFRVPPPHRS